MKIDRLLFRNTSKLIWHSAPVQAVFTRSGMADRRVHHASQVGRAPAAYVQ